jgi:MYXO-CTERM domain-containing protein
MPTLAAVRSNTHCARKHIKVRGLQHFCGMPQPPFSLVFKFARSTTPDDPYAFRFGPQSCPLRNMHGDRKGLHLDASEEFLHDLDALHAPQCAPGTARRVSRLGSLGLTLSAVTLAFVFLPGHASAQTSSMIDDFSVGQDPVFSSANGLELSSVSPGQGVSILGGERDIAVTRLGGALSVGIEVFADFGALTYYTDGGGTFGRATIVWDGNDDAAGTNSIAFDGLRSMAAPVDLTFGGLTDQIDISTASGDILPLTVGITLFADAQTYAVIERTQPNGVQILSFRFSDFVLTGDAEAFDITDVGAIRLDLITSAASSGLDVDLYFVQTSSSVAVTMVDQVLDGEGNPKGGATEPGDIIRYTVVVENPDDRAGLDSTPLEFVFNPALPPTSGLTALAPGSVIVPVGARVVEGNGPGDERVVIGLDPIPDQSSVGACPTDNTVAGCISFTFDVVVGQTLPPDLLREIEGASFLPAQGTLTSLAPNGISTTLLTSDPDVLSPARSHQPPLENLTRVFGFCGDGGIDPGEACDGGRAGSADCTAGCLVASCPSGVDCDPTCTPGVPGGPPCHACTSDEQCDSMDCRVIEDDRGICVYAGCGDGTLQDNEGCDDGNRTAGDGCNASCRIERCTTYPDCDRTCEHVPGAPSPPAPPCSACNDTAPGLTGDDSCASGMCDRDDGTGVCMPSPVCGNGTLDIGEGCDDGNTTSGDGCNEMCRIESVEVIGDCRLGGCAPPVSCTPGSRDCAACNTTSPGATGDASCASGYCNDDGFCQDCGDGNLDRYEGCDDQNTAGDDGCSATCLVESCPAGRNCPLEPSCTPGSPDCNICNSNPDGATGDASCASGYCAPRTNTCGPRLQRDGGCGCSATAAGAESGLGVMLVVCMGWLLRRRRSVARHR